MADVRSPEGPAPSEAKPLKIPNGIEISIGEGRPGEAATETEAILMAQRAWQATDDSQKFDQACPPIVYSIARAAYRIGLRGRAAVGERCRYCLHDKTLHGPLGTKCICGCINYSPA